MLIDSHCHLNYKELSEHLDVILSRCSDNDVQMLQSISVNMNEFPQVLALARRDDRIVCSVGVHPLHVDDHEMVTTGKIVQSVNSDPKVVGIGETGLDYFREKDIFQRKKQQESFARHIIASQETGVPLIIHTRDADVDTIELLEYYGKNNPIKAVIHCFTSSAMLAEKCLDMGLFLSFSGIITFNKTDDLKDIVRNTPMGRILVETDSPYLAPVPHRGKANEPSYVKYVAMEIAQIKSISFEEVAHMTTKNFFTLFSKAKSEKLN